MNPNADDHPLREKIQRRELTAAELAELRAWLASHPEAQADWEAEKDLSRLLARLPDAPVPTNFTARVLQSVGREEAARRRTRNSGPWWLRVLLPRMAATAAVVGLGFVGYQQYAAAQRGNLVKGLAAITSAEALPNAEALEDFEVIRRMTPAADEELLALMK